VLDGVEIPPHGNGQLYGLSGPLKSIGVSAALYATKGIIPSSITAFSERDYSLLNGVRTCDAAFRPNSLTIGITLLSSALSSYLRALLNIHSSIL